MIPPKPTKTFYHPDFLFLFNRYSSHPKSTLVFSHSSREKEKSFGRTCCQLFSLPSASIRYTRGLYGRRNTQLSCLQSQKKTPFSWKAFIKYVKGRRRNADFWREGKIVCPSRQQQSGEELPYTPFLFPVIVSFLVLLSFLKNSSDWQSCLV